MKNILALIILVLLSNILYAQTATPRANIRQKAQRVRIAEGRKDGDLTKGEAAVINNKEAFAEQSEEPKRTVR